MSIDTKLIATVAAASFVWYSFSWAAKNLAPGTSLTNLSNKMSSPFEPTVADVLVVKAMLAKALLATSSRLPPEIVDVIVDLAEYWPHTTAELNDSTIIARGNQLSGRSSGDGENVFLLRSPPLGLHSWKRVSQGLNPSPPHKRAPNPRPPGDEFAPGDFEELTVSPLTLLAHPCRRIVFTIRSHDQGWGGDMGAQDSYNSSWTWFEAGLERWCKNSPAESTPATSIAQEDQQKSPPDQQSGDPKEQQPLPISLDSLSLNSLSLDTLCTVFPPIEWSSQQNKYTFQHQLNPHEDLKVQCNRVAIRETLTHRVVWSHTDDIRPDRDSDAEAVTNLATVQGRGKATGDGKFVRDLKLGDVVTLWAKARFPSWTNNVESVKLEVYYAI
ncbi:uncharacterized protein C8A04DRAFT_10967 [Dichotomopilus funicola]|uniref:Uncharacterized protein n=1 Tax=Dichotomopilus funicola TaxID=1934379 RepID=A0AAN6V7I4_9PEZI|nr:hypothetical protein C8A04DRAFT_10967 [Dichotomopilus funicola]